MLAEAFHDAGPFEHLGHRLADPCKHGFDVGVAQVVEQLAELLDRRGVDVGIAGVRREQMPWVSVSISMGTWLAAMSVVGWSVSGWVVVWFGGCRDQK